MKIGIDVGGTNLRAGLIEGDRLVKKESAPLTDKDNLDSTLSQIISLINSLKQPSLEGIGLGVPSVVDAHRGIIYDVVNIPSWKEVHLKDILENEFNIPVYVNNDSNCFALGEHRFGQLSSFTSAIGLTLGTGLGGGIIIDNELYMGPNCGAGEIGMLPYLNHNIEYYCSNNFFKVFYDSSALHMYQEAKNGSNGAMATWHKFGEHMGNALKAVLYAFDPEAIVIGGSLSKASIFFEKSMLKNLSDFAYPESLKTLKVCFSTDPDIALYGAAALIQSVAPVQ